MVSCKNSNLNANEGFVILLTSKLITCFIGGFTLTMKPQSIAHLLNGNEHIYWILDLEGEVQSIWDLWASGLQECKSNEFFGNQASGQQFSVGSRNFLFSRRAAAPAQFWNSKKFVRGSLTSSLTPSDTNKVDIFWLLENLKVNIPKTHLSGY